MTQLSNEAQPEGEDKSSQTCPLASVDPLWPTCQESTQKSRIRQPTEYRCSRVGLINQSTQLSTRDIYSGHYSSPWGRGRRDTFD